MFPNLSAISLVESTWDLGMPLMLSREGATDGSGEGGDAGEATVRVVNAARMAPATIALIEIMVWPLFLFKNVG